MENPFEGITEKGVGNPGTPQRKEVVDSMYNALDSLSTNQKAHMINELSAQVNKITDAEELLGVYAILTYLNLGIRKDKINN